MNILVVRHFLNEHCTIGSLVVDGVRQCWTLEDKVRKPFVKIPGETAIPGGTYQVDVTLSQRFGVPTPIVLNVPQFEGIRIHPGNTDKDTEGCILVGMHRDGDVISGSGWAYGLVLMQVYHARKSGETVTITITEGKDYLPS